MAKHPSEECVVLAQSVWGFNGSKTGYGKRRELIDYARDAKQIAQFREEMRIINHHLSGANITMALEYDGPPIDTTRDQLRRSFSLPKAASTNSPAFTHGGRLFVNGGDKLCEMAG